MKTELFDFQLPAQQIAQVPLAERDGAKLLVLDRARRAWQDSSIRDLPQWLLPGDVLIVNDTRVIPARLRATRDRTGGKVEFLLVPSCGAGFQPAKDVCGAGFQPAKKPEEISEPPLKLGSCILRKPEIASIVQNALLHFEGTRYFLSGWCVMPNHVHVVVTPLAPHTLPEILHSWKSFTSNQINRKLGLSGTLWERESFDHVIRSSEEWERLVSYTEENPVAAGLCNSADKWPFSSKGTAFKRSDKLEFVDPRTTPFAPLQSRGELPHLYKDSTTYFVTFRLYDAIAPKSVAGWKPAPQGLGGEVIRRALTRSGGKLAIGETFTLAGGLKATLSARFGSAGDDIAFRCSTEQFESFVLEHGEVPLPPYIHRPAGPSSGADRERYQTVFAHSPGAVAAPTAGLHFTPRLLEGLKERGVLSATVTLHVGPGTFKPVKTEDVEAHTVDAEPYTIPAATVAAIRQARRESRRVIAVGTTSLRALESCADELLADLAAPAAALAQRTTDLFVFPPHNFRVVDALLSNFHVPRSSLLMLAAAFAAPGSLEGIEFVKRAYLHAIEAGYRFYSYGDACLYL